MQVSPALGRQNRLEGGQQTSFMMNGEMAEQQIHQRGGLSYKKEDSLFVTGGAFAEKNHPPPLTMAHTGIVSTSTQKRGRGRPPGSKNKNSFEARLQMKNPCSIGSMASRRQLKMSEKSSMMMMSKGLRDLDNARQFSF